MYLHHKRERMSLHLPTRVSVGILAAMLMIIGMVMMTAPSAHAASASASAQCSVHQVQLHGQHPATITCIRHGSIPFTYHALCDPTYNTAIINTSSMGTWCFDGAGYTGLNPNLHNVTSVYGNCFSNGWILEYNTHPAQKAYFNDNGIYSGPRPPYTDVTQLDVINPGCA